MEAVPGLFAHWDTLLEGVQHSPQEFYGALEVAIQKREIPEAKLSRVAMKEGGLFSGSREYLRVKRNEHVFDVCGAPFGRAFFVSWWLTEQQG